MKVREILAIKGEHVHTIQPDRTILDAVAPLVGGRGGGKAELAQGGGDRPEQVDAALQRVYDFVAEQLASGGDQSLSHRGGRG